MKITGEEFKRAVSLDPAWASKLTEPVEVTGWCLMKGSKITHLSPLLTFRPDIENLNECAISFEGCKIKKAEGVFHGVVAFNNSELEEIGDLTCYGDDNGEAAYFNGCQNLKVAQGTFHGEVNFSHSGIEKIDPEKLIVTRPGVTGIAAKFSYCPKLDAAEGDFPGSAHFYNSGIRKIKTLTAKPNANGFRLDFVGCDKLERCPDGLLNNSQITMDKGLITRTIRAKNARLAMKQTSIEF